GREQPVPPGEQVALEPALAAVLAQHLHDAAVGGDVVVAVANRSDETAVLDIEDVAQSIGVRLVRAEQPKISLRRVPAEDIPKELSQLAGRLVALRRRPLD